MLSVGANFPDGIGNEIIFILEYVHTPTQFYLDMYICIHVKQARDKFRPIEILHVVKNEMEIVRYETSLKSKHRNM